MESSAEKIIKVQQKRYYHCEKCGSYTRAPIEEPNFFFLLLGGFLIALIRQWVKSKPPKVCVKCGSSITSKEIFLRTEMGKSRKEIAFYLPSGDRVQSQT
ncbi:MAG: hypothetical protein WCT08_00795 [Patescibacteria group bacterium]|jgi:predicted nucleic-acid-binding Zn-ribbon protein